MNFKLPRRSGIVRMSRGPGNRRAQRTSRTGDQCTRGPEDQRTEGLVNHGTISRPVVVVIPGNMVCHYKNNVNKYNQGNKCEKLLLMFIFLIQISLLFADIGANGGTDKNNGKFSPYSHGESLKTPCNFQSAKISALIVVVIVVMVVGINMDTVYR